MIFGVYKKFSAQFHSVKNLKLSTE